MDSLDKLRSSYTDNKYAYLILTQISQTGGNKEEYEKFDNPYSLESLNGEDNGFPYSKNFMPDPDTSMEMLKQTIFNTRINENRIVLKRFFPGDHILTDSISNHFTEKIRMECEFNKFDTPIKTWNDRVRSDVKAKLEKGDDLSYRQVFEMVYNDDQTRFCNTFNEAYASWIIRSVAERIGKDVDKIRLLDPSSGWGDRLIASYSAGIAEYKGYDPNAQLSPLYDEIISKFGKGSNTIAQILELPFEESDDRIDHYDIVLTSPPYFAYEIYDEGEGQSATKYPDYEDWVEKMYRPYVQKAYGYLRDGGVIVIYIEDITINGKKYNLSKLTNSILSDLGAETDISYGLNVKYKPGRSNRVQKIKKDRSKKSHNHKGRMKGRYANSWMKPVSITNKETDKETNYDVELGVITKSVRDDLQPIVSDLDLMKTIANGEVWSEEKLDKFISYSIAEEEESNETRKNFYNTITLKHSTKKKVVGVIGIHKISYSPKLREDFFLTVFVNRSYHGRGVGRKAIALAVKNFIDRTGRSVYAHVRPENVASSKSLVRAGFVRDETIDTLTNDIKLIGYVYSANQIGGDSDVDIDKTISIHTFIAHMDSEILRRVFEERSRALDSNIDLRWLDSKKPVQETSADIMILDGKSLYDHDLFDIKANLKGRLKTTDITNKVNLHQNIKDDFLPETYVIDREIDYSFMNGKDWWIWRPEMGYKGRGIEYIRTVEEAQKLQRQLLKKHRGEFRHRALISKVIKDPLLYYVNGGSNSSSDGYKFHFRMYFIIYKSQAGEFKAYLVNKGEIFTAETPYIHAKFEDKSIHDTHQESTIGSPTYPKYCDRLGIASHRLNDSDCSLILDSMVDILKTIVSKDFVRDKIEVYPESKSGYEIMGCDFMIDRSGKVFLLEINDKIGFPEKTESTYEWLNTIIANALFETVIGPRFFGTGTDNLEYAVVVQ
jgi:RimJ/RimL family protein N-acetyltransferase